jgi:hypothetical protein
VELGLRTNPNVFVIGWPCFPSQSLFFGFLDYFPFFLKGMSKSLGFADLLREMGFNLGSISLFSGNAEA